MFPARWAAIPKADETMRCEWWDQLKEMLDHKPPAAYRADRRPWNFILAHTAYGVEESIASTWWDHRVKQPCNGASSSGAAIAVVNRVEGLGDGVGLDRSRSPPPDRRPTKPTKPTKPDKGAGKGEVCRMFNANQGKCKGKKVCPAGRKHACSICNAFHAAVDCPRKKGR